MEMRIHVSELEQTEGRKEGSIGHREDFFWLSCLSPPSEENLRLNRRGTSRETDLIPSLVWRIEIFLKILCKSAFPLSRREHVLSYFIRYIIHHENDERERTCRYVKIFTYPRTPVDRCRKMTNSVDRYIIDRDFENRYL